MHFLKGCVILTKLIRSASEYPGVAKFGIALEWGSRGLEFESQHSDQRKQVFDLLPFFVFRQSVLSQTVSFFGYTTRKLYGKMLLGESWPFAETENEKSLLHRQKI